MRMCEGSQELLEELWMAIEEENRAGLPRSADVIAGAAELVQDGLAEWRDNYLALTASGMPEASGAVRRHRLAERLMLDVLGTEDALMEERACQFEHALVDGVEESVCTLLGHPRFCPHGKPIPPGKCCAEMRRTADPVIASLAELNPGQRGHIAYIRMNDPARLQKLMAMGVLPGVAIALQRRTPSFVIDAGYSQFAMDGEMAADIYVRLDRNTTS